MINMTLFQLNDTNEIQVLAKPESGIKQFLKIKTQIYFFSKFNFGDNHVFYFYHTFVGKQEMKRKHQKTCPKCGKFHDNFLHHLFLWVRKKYFCYQSFQLPGIKSWYFSSIWAISKHEGIVISWSMANLSQ